MAKTGAAAERLRAFVRARVRTDGAHYQRGNAVRLAEALGKDPPWVTGYVDFPPTRHADLDQAITIARFFRLPLASIIGDAPLPDVEAAPKEDADVLRLVRAARRMRPEQRAALLNVARELARLSPSALFLESHTEATKAAHTSPVPAPRPRVRGSKGRGG